MKCYGSRPRKDGTKQERANRYERRMLETDNHLTTWAWIFLCLYVGVMVICGLIGMRRVKSSDDFAVARGSYGPVFLAFALVATTASGGTFLGLPAITYTSGLSGLWFLVYPLGVYTGIIICMGAVRRAGKSFGNRSIPEYLGDRYQSDFLRLAVAIFSLLLLFYLAAQLLAGTVMFEQMMGIPKFWALFITTFVLLVYIGIGGAHADILTDGVQGALMIGLAIFVVVLFCIGFGVDGGFYGMVDRLHELDPQNLAMFRPDNPIVSGWWAVFAIWASHLPLGMLPHIGNKLWALSDNSDRRVFFTLIFVLGFMLPCLAFGGVLARAVLGDELLTGSLNPNYSIPALFVAILPAWLAALLGAGVLAAVMSTADGLAVSASQIFANDIYRRTIAPRYHASRDSQYIDRMALRISRISTLCVLLGAMAMAWAFQKTNIALLIWLGVGGMMSALAGPFMVGVLWRGLTKAGAYAGFFSGAAVFLVLKMGFLDTEWASGTSVEVALNWLVAQTPNPFSCATLGILVSVFASIAVSHFTTPLPESHLKRIFTRM